MKFQFRLLTFCVIVTLVGATLGVAGLRSYRLKCLTAANRQINEKGGDVIWGDPVRIVQLYSQEEIDRCTVGLPSLTVTPYPSYGIKGDWSATPSHSEKLKWEPVWIQFTGVSIDAESFGNYQSKTPLAIDFLECHITEDAVDKIPANVKWLSITDCQLPKSLVPKLGKLPELDWCEISLSSLTSLEQLSEIAKSDSISTLVLTDIRLSQKDIQSFCGMKNLTQLFIIRCEIYEPVDWSAVLENSNLRILSTYSSGVPEKVRQSVRKSNLHWPS